MRILYHAINGHGLGHVVRLSWIARAVALRDSSVKQMMVSSSRFAQDYFLGHCHHVPCHILDPVGHDWRFQSCTREFDPDVIVYDTRWPLGEPHKSDGTVPRKVLVLRGNRLDVMQNEIADARSYFDRIVIPHTWDELCFYYSSDQRIVTALQRPPFLIVGPVARKAMRSPHESPIVFSLGAGGTLPAGHHGKVNMRADTFVKVGEILLAKGHSNLKLVVGPYLEAPQDLGPLVPFYGSSVYELLGPSSCVVSRGGYNTCWESIAAKSHLVVSSSENIMEDVQARCEYLSDREYARWGGGEPDEIAEAVIRGRPPNVEFASTLVNQGLEQLVDAIVSWSH